MPEDRKAFLVSLVDFQIVDKQETISTNSIQHIGIMINPALLGPDKLEVDWRSQLTT